MIAVMDVSPVMDMLVARGLQLRIECGPGGAHIAVNRGHDGYEAEFHAPTFLAVLDACARAYGVIE